MEHNNQALLDRVKKLLELSKSSNPNEAAIALARAQKLMQEHSISVDDITLSDIIEKKEDIPSSLRDKVLFTRLAAIVGKSFGLEWFFTHDYNYSYKHVTFIGPKDRLESACYTYTILSRQAANVKKQFSADERARLRKQFEQGMNELGLGNLTFTSQSGRVMPLFDFGELYKDEINRQVRKNTKAYIEGWLLSVYNKVVDFASDDKEDKLIECYMKKNHPNLNTMRRSTRKLTQAQLNAYNQGKTDGRDGFDLYHGVNGTAAQRLGFKN